MSIARHLPHPLHRLAVQTVYGLLNAVSPPGLPVTGAAFYLNTCFHTEHLDDDRVYHTLLTFCRRFTELTGVRTWQCVMTPKGPLVGNRLAASGFSAEAYGERILALAEVADIGYHGHFVSPDGTPMAGDAFHVDTVRAQLQAEIVWLEGLGLAPLVYTGGWWVLNPELLALLSQAGIRLDCSTRGALGGTHGDRYPDPVPRVGQRFRLVPPIVEIGSLPYFAMPWARWVRTMMQHLPDLGQRPQWAVLPQHDYALVGGAGDEWRIVERLSRLPYVRWVSLAEAIDHDTDHIALPADDDLG